MLLFFQNLFFLKYVNEVILKWTALIFHITSVNEYNLDNKSFRGSAPSSLKGKGVLRPPFENCWAEGKWINPLSFSTVHFLKNKKPTFEAVGLRLWKEDILRRLESYLAGASFVLF